MTAFNDRAIAEFRANDGLVVAWGSHLVLIHHRGSSGRERVNPAMSLRDGEDWLVVGSAMGAPRDPSWAVDLRARPDATIEAVVDEHATTVPVRATELQGDARAAAFERFVEVAPAFEAYQARASRLLPVIRLARRTPAAAPGWTGSPADAPGVGIGPDDPGRTITVR